MTASRFGPTPEVLGIVRTGEGRPGPRQSRLELGVAAPHRVFQQNRPEADGNEISFGLADALVPGSNAPGGNPIRISHEQ
jgi:hypothetical protein